MRIRYVLPALVLASGAGCATVHASYTVEDWKRDEASQVKRLAVVVTPLPKGDSALGSLFASMARNYANLKRNFIVKTATALPPAENGLFEAKAQCAAGLEGVLWLAPDVKDVPGKKVDAAVHGQLVRCPDGRELWRAEASGTWNQVDTSLSEMTANEVKDQSPLVTPYVAPFFHLLKPTLDTLPNPVLSDAEQVEKTEND
jgi:probable lipoprotein (TIGR04455 family)